MPRKLDRRHRARLPHALFDCDLTATTFQSLIETAGSPIICLDRQFPITALQPPRAIAEAAVRHLEGVTGCEAAAVVAHDAVARRAVRLASAGADPLSIPDARPLDAADFAESGWPDSPGAPLTVPLIANNVRL